MMSHWSAASRQRKKESLPPTSQEAISNQDRDRISRPSGKTISGGVGLRARVKMVLSMPKSRVANASWRMASCPPPCVSGK